MRPSIFPVSASPFVNMNPSFFRALLFTSAVASAFVAAVSARAADDLRLESFAYPFPVRMHRFTSQQQPSEMAYMDVQPAHGGEAADVVVLMHGKNFSGAYWEETARALRDAGFRVIIPDQLGFGKSTKPPGYQFTFQQLAANTHDLLGKLGVTRAHIVGHSMGGMLAVRYALMFPQETRSLILVNPLGLEDWKAKGVPYRTVDTNYQQELKQSAERIRAYQRENYYGGNWKPAYDRWVEMLVVFTRSPDYRQMAWNQALTSDMIYSQSVVYEFGAIKAPTLLLIGQRDRTAPGRDAAPEALRSSLGNYTELGRSAAKAIPGAKLVELQGIGHAPHIEAFPRFIEPLQEFLRSQK
jgi:pimeloyl-ACP methyl ester carboxylesterase